MFYAARLRRYVRRRQRQLDKERPDVAQQKQLRKLVRAARSTQFGRDHDFRRMRSVDDFQQRVPLRSFEQFRAEYWRPQMPDLVNCTWPGGVSRFALTAGVTGEPKRIPWTREMQAAFVRGERDALTQHLLNRPESGVLGGRCCRLFGGASREMLADGLPVNTAEALLDAQRSWWTRRRYFPSRRIARIGDWNERRQAMAAIARRKNVRMIAGMPSAIALFCDDLLKSSGATDGRLAHALPRLELVLSTGTSAAPYKRRLEKLLAGGPAELRETWCGAEGFYAVGDRACGEGLRLLGDNGVFFEFVPLDDLHSEQPTRHWIGNVEPGVQYAVAVSTCAGLWGYVNDDIVKFVETSPPRVLVTGRVSQWRLLSEFGEGVLGEQLEEAVAAAATSNGKQVAEFAVAAIAPETPRKPGRHQFAIEFADAEPPNKRQVTAIGKIIDERIQQRNAAYRAARSGDAMLRSPRVQVVPAGTFAGWLKSCGAMVEPPKAPRVLPETELDALLEFAEASQSRRRKAA